MRTTLVSFSAAELEELCLFLSIPVSTSDVGSVAAVAETTLPPDPDFGAEE